jgi:branched-chain amino acid transport system substrate-binding protein
VQRFVAAFKAKYNRDPDTFNATAYDTMVLTSTLVNRYGTTRAAIRQGIAQIRDVPSVIFGTIQFDTETRRVAGARYKRLIVRDGRFQLFEGGTPS